MRLTRLFIPIIILSAWSVAQLASHDQVLPPPSQLNPGLYPAESAAKKDIASALAKAAKEHKNVILDFGANWCLDCHALENAFKTNPEIHPMVEKNYVVVHVNIGQDDPPKNNALAAKYGINTEKGIPALAVVSPAGKTLYSQQNHEFSSARKLKVQAVVDFLEKWKPRKQ